ncbi:MAG TPA: glycosyltransferase, partial [Bacteroidales bacterium]|nr:glycosyltransferase [Bacteroidales bacterium]
ARFLLIGNETNAVKQLFSDPENQLPSNLFSPGYAEQPLDAVAQANIVVNLSLFTESFGRTVLEAMAARRPVVAYDNGAISELIEEGKSGFLVPFRDVFAAAEKIIHLCNHPDQLLEMGEYGRKLALEKYSLRVYDHILGDTMTKILSQWPHIKSAGEKTETRSNAGVRISVVIPNYNYSHYLGERIRSIVAQTLPPAEIIFLDDASSDDSLQVVRPLLESSGIPFRIEVNETNQGVYRQWIKGIEMATGEYLWIAEADDSCEQDFLEKLSRRMTDDGSVIAYCQSRRIGDQGQILAPDNLHHTDDLSRERWLHDYTETGLREVTDYLLYRNSIPNASACLFKKSALKDLPEDFSGFRFVGDWFLYAWLLSKGPVSFLAESLNHFRRHSESVTRVKGKSEDYLEELVRIKGYIVNNFPVHKQQLRTMISFLNKDHVIEGWKVNADHPSVKALMKEAEYLASVRRRFVFLTTNNGSHNGGSEQLWIQTALDSRKAGHDVMAIIKKWEPAPWFFDAFGNAGIKLLFKEGLDFGEVVRFGPDLMIISTGDQDEGIEWFDLCQKHNIPYAIVNQLTKEPEYWPIRPEKTQPVLRGYLGAEIAFFTSRNNHRVMEKRLGQAIPNAGFFYQPFFVDRSVELPYPSADAGLKLALPSRLLTIHKGQHLALEVINQKKWRDRLVILNFYGVGPDEKKLKEMAAKYGLSNVHFHEPRWKLPDPDLFDIWRENHALLMPSFMEGMPLVLLNAMICGRVPIVTDIGGHKEVIEDNVNGFIAARPSVEALDEAMERAYLQKDHWKEIGQKARQTILAYLPEDPVGHFTAQLVNHARK